MFCREQLSDSRHGGRKPDACATLMEAFPGPLCPSAVGFGRPQARRRAAPATPQCQRPTHAPYESSVTRSMSPVCEPLGRHLPETATQARTQRNSPASRVAASSKRARARFDQRPSQNAATLSTALPKLSRCVRVGRMTLAREATSWDTTGQSSYEVPLSRLHGASPTVPPLAQELQ